MNTQEGEISLPGEIDDILPDVPLWEMDIEPTAVAYVLEGEQGEWEHKFECETAPKAYAARFEGKGVFVIVGNFDLSPIFGFSDECEID